VGAFWTDAGNIFETARQASQGGSPDCDWAILIDPQGAIRMLPADGWALSSLLAQHDAATAYRVTRESGRVCLEGRRGLQSCLLRSESPAAAARQLLARHLPCAAGSMPGAARLAAGAAAQPAQDLEGTWKIFA